MRDVPKFRVLKCIECHSSITGSMYTSGNKSLASSTICEECYWEYHYGDNAYVKLYRHSVAEDALELAKQQKVCSCNGSRVVRQGYDQLVKGKPHNKIYADPCPISIIPDRIALTK